ncbi:MAG: hypothetical protein SGBAC_011109, partial [Bacillariaceae sp.]
MTVEMKPPVSAATSESMQSSSSKSPDFAENKVTTEKAKQASILPLRTNDKKTCTGILLMKDQMQFFKLNYPTDTTIDGGGHVMSELEIISECSQYQLEGQESSFLQEELAEFQQNLKRIKLRSFHEPPS